MRLAFAFLLLFSLAFSAPRATGAAEIADSANSIESGEARNLIENHKWAEAAIVLRSEITQNPGSLPIALDLARTLVLSGRREDALTVLEQRLNRERSAKIRTALIRRIRILAQVFLTSSDFQLHQDGVNLMMVRKYRTAREKFDKAIEQEPSNVDNLIRVGQCMVLAGDYDSAAERLRLARRLDPYEPEVRLWLGRALHQRGEINEAMEELKAAYDEQPGSEIAAIWYAEALVSLGQRDQALRVLENDVQRKPDNVGSLVALARLRLTNSSPRDSQAAWASRRDLQLALSRLPAYLDAASSSALPMPAAPSDSPSVIAASSDLSLDQRRPEEDLKREIDKLMATAEARISQL